MRPEDSSSTTTPVYQFMSAGKYLHGWTPGTIAIYKRAPAAFGETPLTKPALDAWVVALRQRGHSIGGVNVLTRAVSSYLSWLHEEGHTREHLRIKQIPNSPKAIKVFSDVEVRLARRSHRGCRL